MNYVLEIAMKYDITMIQETFVKKLKTLEKLFFKNDIIKLYPKFATRRYKLGRGSGGMLIISKMNLNIKVDYYNERICKIKVGDLIIVPAYMIHSGDNINQLEYECDTIVLSNIANNTWRL